jgi:ankyrin repeat protein
LLEHADATGRRAVHYATASGHLEFVQKSLEKKPELAQMADDTGWTLLLIAASAGHTEVVRHLLANPLTNVNQRFED